MLVAALHAHFQLSMYLRFLDQESTVQWLCELGETSFPLHLPPQQMIAQQWHLLSSAQRAG